MDRRSARASAFLVVVVSTLLLLVSCSDAVSERARGNVASNNQNLKQTTGLTKDVVFVIDGDGESMGGQCDSNSGYQYCPGTACKATPDGSNNSDPFCCRCAGTAPLSAAIEGVARALEKLPRDGTVEVSVLVSSWGAWDGTAYTGPHTILDNVLWVNPSETADGGATSDAGTPTLHGKLAEYIAKVRAFTPQDLQVQDQDAAHNYYNDCEINVHGFPVDCVPPASLDWGIWEASRHLNHENVKGALCFAYANSRLAPYRHQPSNLGMTYLPAHVSGFSQPVRGDQIPAFQQTLSDAINAQHLSDFTVVKVPFRNYFWPDRNVYGVTGRYLYSLTGRLSEPGLVSIQLNCPANPSNANYIDPFVDNFSVALFPSVTENNQVRSTTLAEHAAKITAVLREHYYAGACHNAPGDAYDQACVSSYPENIDSIDNLIWVNLRSETRWLRECDLTIDVSTSPGLRLTSYATPPVDTNGWSTVDDKFVSKDVALERSGGDLPSWAPLLSPVRGRWAIAGLPGEFPTSEQIRDAVADCFSPRPTVRAIEVNQSIQAWDNHIPLIGNKRTAVRVFLESDTPTTVRPLLRAYRRDCDGTPCREPLSLSANSASDANALDLEPMRSPAVNPGDAVNARSNAKAGIDSFSHVFILPSAWTTGAVELEVRSPNGSAFDCAEPAGAPTATLSGDPANDCAVRVSFDSRPELQKLNSTPVRILWSADTLPDGGPRPPSMDGGVPWVDQAIDFSASRVLIEEQLPIAELHENPTHDVRLALSPLLSKSAPVDLSDFEGYSKEFSGKLLEEATALIAWIKAWDCLKAPSDQCAEEGILRAAMKAPKSIYAGLTTPASGSTLVNYCSALVDGLCSSELGVSAHEFFHALGRPHTPYCMRQLQVSQDAECSGFPSENVRYDSLLLEGDSVFYHPGFRPLLGPVDASEDTRLYFSRNSSAARGEDYGAQDATFDIMSYCRGDLVRWVSDFQYDRLMEHVAAFNGANLTSLEHIATACPNRTVRQTQTTSATCPLNARPKGPASCDPQALSTVLFVRARAQASSESLSSLTHVDLRELLRSDTAVVEQPGGPTQKQPVLIVNLLDASGAVLQQASVDARIFDYEASDDNAFEYMLSATIADDPRAVTLSMTLNGIEVARKMRSATIPSVSALQARIEGDDLVVEWNTDVDGAEEARVSGCDRG
jgi:hypothetical protein